MAGLLDIFGTGGTETLGLLGMSPEAIQGSRDDAQAQALYALAGRLFQGGGTGASIAQGLQQGQQAYKSAMQGQLQEQLQAGQLQELLRKRKQEQEALARQAQIERAVSGAYRPAMAGTPAQMVEEDGRYMGETPAVAGRAAGLDFQSLAPALMASPEGRKTLAELMASQKAMRPETFSLAEGAQQFERDPFTGETRQVATGAAKREPIQFQDLGNVVIGIQGGKEVLRLPKGRAPEGAVSNQIIETDQGMMAINPRTLQMTPLTGAEGKPLTKAGKPTETESNAAGFANRMLAAQSITQKFETVAGSPGTLESIYKAIPLIGDKIPAILPESVKGVPLGGYTPERRQYLQAANNFIRANLRKESGAAIGADEWLEEFKNYFPQLGDDPDTIKQKQGFRDILTKNMVRTAGKALQVPEVAPVRQTPQNTQTEMVQKYPGLVVNPKLKKLLED